MPSNASEELPTKETNDDLSRWMDHVLDILPKESNRIYNMKEIVKELVDDGNYFEFRSTYGPEECDKATVFICLCDSFHIPLIFLHDTPGFRVSNQAEKEKMPTKIMVWSQALAQSTVPKISIIIRKSVVAAHGNMCGPTMGADLVATWPTAEVNFTWPEVGIIVVYGRQLECADDPK